MILALIFMLQIIEYHQIHRVILSSEHKNDTANAKRDNEFIEDEPIQSHDPLLWRYSTSLA